MYRIKDILIIHIMKNNMSSHTVYIYTYIYLYYYIMCYTHTHTFFWRGRNLRGIVDPLLELGLFSEPRCYRRHAKRTASSASLLKHPYLDRLICQLHLGPSPMDCHEPHTLPRPDATFTAPITAGVSAIQSHVISGVSNHANGAIQVCMSKRAC